MKRILLLAVAIFGLAGCDEIDGLFSVKSSVTLKNNKGKAVTVKPADYKADVALNTKKKIAYLDAEIDGSTIKFPFKYDVEIDPDSPKTVFKIPASQSGQPVDLSGSLENVVTDGSLKRGYEGCWYDRWEQVCEPLPKGGVSCHMERREVWGQQYVEYFVRSTTHSVKFNLAASGQKTLLADYNGERVDRVKIYEYQEICH